MLELLVVCRKMLNEKRVNFTGCFYELEFAYTLKLASERWSGLLLTG